MSRPLLSARRGREEGWLTVDLEDIQDFPRGLQETDDFAFNRHEDGAGRRRRKFHHDFARQGMAFAIDLHWQDLAFDDLFLPAWRQGFAARNLPGQAGGQRFVFPVATMFAGMFVLAAITLVVVIVVLRTCGHVFPNQLTFPNRDVDIHPGFFGSARWRRLRLGRSAWRLMNHDHRRSGGRRDRRRAWMMADLRLVNDAACAETSESSQGD